MEVYEILINDSEESPFFYLISWRMTEEKNVIIFEIRKKKILLERFILNQNFKVTHPPKISFEVLITRLRKSIRSVWFEFL